MPVTKTLNDLFEEAMAEVETVSVAEALAMMDTTDAVIVDIRDVRELWRDGTIPGAVHAPRGMLEAWLDPTSPYHKPIFSADKKLVFFCAGGVRSALAAKTAQDMGLADVVHIGGGYAAWRKAGAPTETVKPA